MFGPSGIKEGIKFCHNHVATMTKVGGASKRKRTSSGDGERGKLVLEVVEPAVEEPEEKASIAGHKLLK